MRRYFAVVLILTCVIAGSAAIRQSVPAADAQPAPPGGQRPDRPPGGGPPPGFFAAAPGDSFVAERDSIVKALLAKIAGREEAPAESVFKNIKTLKGAPAGRLPLIMNIAFSRSLGVRCQHCHDQDKWDSDDNPKKQVARDMWEMMKTINADLLPKIKNLKSEKPGINCTTCHRGSKKPALNMQ
jgi:hypothetical protein